MILEYFKLLNSLMPLKNLTKKFIIHPALDTYTLDPHFHSYAITAMRCNSFWNA